MKLTKPQREKVREMFGGKCAYCGCVLPAKGWHADHIKPVCRELKWGQDPKTGYVRMVATGKLGYPESDHIDNIYPACAPCNIDKGPNDLEGWRRWLGERIVDGLRRNSSTFRHAERFGRVKIEEGPLVFWFEKYELTSESPYLIPPQVDSAHLIEAGENFWVGDEWWPLSIKATDGER